MIYERMEIGRFIERPNRFIAYVEINGVEEVVHVKNTGRCKELLEPGVTVYVQRASNPERKTKWDLIAVKKGNRLINMDSQITNYAVKEWIEKGNLFQNITSIRSEVTYGNSRMDLYVEADGKKCFIEVKGVTLEEDGVVRFPDAPSERAVKHIHELEKAVYEGYESYVFFVIQMKDVKYFTPNRKTHEAFAEALLQAQNTGVHVIAYDCEVDEASIEIRENVPVILERPELFEISKPIVKWYEVYKRDLPWRKLKDPYHIWVSEIMLQQTRVEAVKPFYYRFMEALPTVQDLAEIEEEQLLKLWEGLGYYNRVRNMQLAACEIMELYRGEFPRSFDEIIKLKGIGSYTAGAISSIAFGECKPAVDGNVLRVICRFLGDDGDIMKASVKKRIESWLEEVIPEGYASEFNQGLIELGAIICVPNGQPKCEQCPISSSCKAKIDNRIDELPVKSKAKARKIEERTILVLKDADNIAIRKRPKKGLLAGLYELPSIEGHLARGEVIDHCKKIGLMPIKVDRMDDSKHIFSHVEWKMIGYEIRVDELEKACEEDMIFIEPAEIQQKYPIPTAFESYMKYLSVKLGQKAYTKS